MKRSLALVALLVFGFSSASYAAVSRTRYSEGNATTAIAPDRVGRWDMGLFAAWAGNSDADDTGFFGANVAYGVTPWIALGLEAGWQEAEVEDGLGQDLGLVPIMADIIIRVPSVHETLVPYGVLGLGVIGAYVNNENNATANGDDVDDVSFGWKLGLGADWFINDHWIMNFEWAYYMSDPDLPRTAVSDVDFWTLGAGLKYIY